MSLFIEFSLLLRLNHLSDRKRSIESLSIWIIDRRRYHKAIVKTWFRELHNVFESKKLAYMYLAHDVIYNSKKKGPEFRTEFSLILPKAFALLGELYRSEKLIASLDHLLQIWSDRGIYDAKTICEYRARLYERKKFNQGRVVRYTRCRADNVNDEYRKRAFVGFGGGTPEAEELIRALSNMDNMASSDTIARERIANLPPQISEIYCLYKLTNKEAGKALTKQLNYAVNLLDDYNTRLAAEMEQRANLAAMLPDFQAVQVEQLAQTEQRLDEYKKKLTKMLIIQKLLKDHLSNLPALTQPQAAGTLPPLPTVDELFKMN